MSLLSHTHTDEYSVNELMGGAKGVFSVGRHRARREDLVLVSGIGFLVLVKRHYV